MSAAAEAHPDKRIAAWVHGRGPRRAEGQDGAGRDGAPVVDQGPAPAGPGARKRFALACLFGAVRPLTGDGFALVMPRVSTEAMSVSLAEFAATLPADPPAVVGRDRAGWHGAKALKVPGTIPLVPRPPCSPELNPVERVWLSLRERHLSHPLLADYDAAVEACCRAWNALTAETGRIRSLTSYPYLEQVSY